MRPSRISSMSTHLHTSPKSIMRLKVSGRLLVRNSLLNFISQAISLLVGVITIPFIVRGLGTDRFGLLSLVWIVLGYFTIFDLGLGRAATKYVAEALGKGEDDQVPRLIWTSVTIQGALGLLGTIILVGITPLLVEGILNIPPALRGEARVTFYLLALSIPAVLVSSSLTGVLAAAQRFDLVNVVSTSCSVVNSLLTLIGVLFLDWHLPAVVTIVVMSRFLVSIVYYWLCVSVFPSFKGPSRFSWAEVHALFGFGGWVTVSSIVGPILVYLDRFMIGTLLTMAAVAYYSAPYEIVTRLWIIPTSLVTALFPMFSTLIGQGQWERLAFFLSRSVKWVLLTLGSVVVVAAVAAHDILQLWLGVAFAEESTPIFQLLSVGVLVNSLAYVPHALMQALGRPDLTAKFHLAELPLHGLLVWWLISMWGTTGAALAWSIRVGVDAMLLYIAAHRILSLSPYCFMSEKVIQTFLCLFLFASIALGINSLPLVMWLRLLGLGLSLMAMGVLGWRYLLDSKDRDQVANLFRLMRVR